MLLSSKFAQEEAGLIVIEPEQRSSVHAIGSCDEQCIYQPESFHSPFVGKSLRRRHG